MTRFLSSLDFVIHDVLKNGPAMRLTTSQVAEIELYHAYKSDGKGFSCNLDIKTYDDDEYEYVGI